MPLLPPSSCTVQLHVAGAGECGGGAHDSRATHTLLLCLEAEGTAALLQHPTAVLPCPQQIMQSFMVDAFEQVAGEASSLIRHNKRKTLTAREVQVRNWPPRWRSRVRPSARPLQHALLCRTAASRPLPPLRLQTAVRLVLPGELGGHAVAEGKRAVARYT